MSEPKTHPVEGVMEVDFNSEPFLSDFKEIYARLHASVALCNMCYTRCWRRQGRSDGEPAQCDTLMSHVSS